MTVLRVVSYNLELGGQGRIDALSAVLATLRPDVVGLTEADDQQIVERLANRLELAYVWAKGSGDRHIATLSRYPISEWRCYNKPPLTQAVLVTALDISHQPLTIYNTHLLPYLLLPLEIRRWQAAGRLLEVVRSRPSSPHLIIGDLNAIGPNDRVLQQLNPPRMRWIMMLQLGIIFRLAVPRLLRAGYTDCYRHLHPDEDGFTWATFQRTTRYDYILADPHMASALRTCRVVDEIPAVFTASDHFPLLAEFQMPS